MGMADPESQGVDYVCVCVGWGIIDESGVIESNSARQLWR